MPASVVVVHDDPTFLNAATVALRDAGYDVAAFEDSMEALLALEGAAQVEVLVTRVSFPEGKPNGVSLALMTRTKRPSLKVIFAAKSEHETFTEGIGELIPHPVDLPTLAESVARLIEEGQNSLLPRREA
jgi:DNA-binding NtrC family response regulator